MKRVHIIVTGTVQGVGFRYSTKAEAEQLGVTGWVRNVGSDRVEIEAQGDADAV
ncbi:MAG TPA: acylphosphatase, partial [Candidatus Microbacterium pullistercoris]|nr:acylphosphatase [Candidatus Microbacterium pullistercoris]